MLTDWLVLNSIDGLGPSRIARLLERYGTPQAVLEQPREALLQSGVVTSEAADALRRDDLREQAQLQEQQAERSGVHILTLADERYPPLLREIFAPPPVIFVQGNLDAFRSHAVAIVGTRGPTTYGARVAASLSHDLTQAGLTVVSGLALGIDTAAHKACLDAGGATVAVLGCGIDVVYPPGNRALATRILERGALVSEFPLGTRPLAQHFPRRNRIISGLSAGVVVVEAGERSGALITATYALQQGREVFAVPGSVFSDKSTGTFNLIKSGATPVRGAADVLDAIHAIRLNTTPSSTVSFPFVPEMLSDEERRLLELLTDQPLRIDELVTATGMAVGGLFDALLNLELKGAVRQLAGQQFVKA